MENVFVPIDARTDPRYLYVKNNPLYKDFFEGFFDYQTDLSFKAGKVNKSSGKAQSYRNHLMKIIVFYKEVYGSYPTSLESEKTAAGIILSSLTEKRRIFTALQLTAILIILTS